MRSSSSAAHGTGVSTYATAWRLRSPFASSVPTRFWSVNDRAVSERAASSPVMKSWMKYGAARVRRSKSDQRTVGWGTACSRMSSARFRKRRMRPGCGRLWTLKRKRSPVGIVRRYAWCERPRGQRSTSAPESAPPETSSAARATSSEDGGTVTVRSTTGATVPSRRARCFGLRRERERELRGDARVRAEERDVRLERASLGRDADGAEQVRRERGARDALALGGEAGPSDLALDLVAVERLAGGDRHREHHPGTARDLLPRDPRGAERVVHAVREVQAARADVERGELVRPEAHHGPPVVERDRRGDRPEGADLRLEQLCGPQAPRSGKAVRDDRGLECNDGALAGDRVGDLWRDGELHESWGVRGGLAPLDR